MKTLSYLTLVLCFFMLSCAHEEKIEADKTIRFSFANKTESSSGRENGSNEAKSILVTITDQSGNVVADRRELLFYSFGEDQLSAPLTLQTSSNNFRLSEFLVLDAEKKVISATPKEGSAKAYLVTDPLDIDFSASKNEITTITPEVLSVDEASESEDYGYGQFGFNQVETIDVVISAFTKGSSNFELSTANIVVQGFNDNSTESFWSYEKELEAKANIITLRKTDNYRITATKSGFKNWERTVSLKQNDKLEILFEDKTPDVYVAGSEGFAKYWKNGVSVQLSAAPGRANGIFVSNGDVYVTGGETGITQPFYWKNGVRVLLPSNETNRGQTSAVYVSGNDVYVTGYIFSGKIEGAAGPAFYYPVYWKNGNLVQLQLPSDGPSYGLGYGFTSFITIDGTDVYIAGQEQSYYNANNGIPVYWKNGIAVRLIDRTSIYNKSFATSIKVKDGHVFVSGMIGKSNDANNHKQAVYWKDGQISILSSKTSYAEDLELVNDDTYVVGFESDSGWKGKYWKNGSEVALDNQHTINLYSIKIINNVIYVAGDYRGESGPTKASFWVDGKRIPCGENQSFAFSIFVDSN